MVPALCWLRVTTQQPPAAPGQVGSEVALWPSNHGQHHSCSYRIAQKSHSQRLSRPLSEFSFIHCLLVASLGCHKLVTVPRSPVPSAHVPPAQRAKGCLSDMGQLVW